MPFVTLDIIKPFISKTSYATIDKTGLFADLEDQAATTIRDHTGFDIPTEVSMRPDWVDSIAAGLIEFLALPQNPDVPEFEQRRILGNYDRSIKALSRYRSSTPNTTPNNFSKAGGFDMEDKW